MPCKACHKQPETRPPRVLFWDTENSTKHGAYYGKKWETSIQWREEDWYFHCYSYAWDDGKVQVVQSFNEKKLVLGMWKLLNEADVVVAHNKTFDLGHFYMKCLKYGLPPPSNFKSICTLRMYRNLCKGGFESNALGDLGVELGFGDKKELERGFWRKVEARDTKAIKKMIAYAGHDIVLLRKVYKVIEPFYPPLKLKIIK